jgi:YidC/Oxa1 family membrane protein insertase
MDSGDCAESARLGRQWKQTGGWSMTMWNETVDILREAMVAYAHGTNGNLAFGILTVTFLARLALFPLMLRLSRSAASHQDRVRRIQPELDAIKLRFRSDPQKAAAATREAFARAGIPMLPMASFLGAIAPAPVLIALYSAVRQCAAFGGRFLWIADISRPDRLLAMVVAAVAVGASTLAPLPEGQGRTLTTFLPAIITMIVLWKMAAGVGLYWGLSSAAGGVQTIMTARGRRA